MFKVKINVTINLYTTSGSIQIISYSSKKISMHTLIHIINKSNIKAEGKNVIAKHTRITTLP